nr:MAG TPA: hypothetical protein [Caudoviricetes sp.]
MKISTQIIGTLIVVSLLELISKESKLAAFIIGLIMVIVILILGILELFGVIAF